MNTLDITALTQRGQAYEIEFPLHPLTRSEQAVSDTVIALLDALSQQTAAHGDVSDGDLIQALVMTLALRIHMAGGNPEAMRKLVTGLYDTAYAAVERAPVHQAGRA